MPIKVAAYDGAAFTSPGVGLVCSRPYDTVDRTGATVAANKPIFDARAGFLAAPTAETVLSTVAVAGGNFSALVGTGVDVDRITPVTIATRNISNTSYRLGIFVGSNWAAGDWDAAPGGTSMAGTGNRAVIKDVLCQAGDLGGANKAGGNRHDILRGSGVAQGEDADWRYEALSCTITEGLLQLWCRAVFWNGSAWQVRATALCAWDDANSRWYLVLRGGDCNIGAGRGQIWNNGCATARGSNGLTDRINPPLDVWSAYVDYQSSPASGTVQSTILSRAVRSSATSRTWTVQAIELSRRTTDAANQHDHSAMVYFGSSGELMVVVCRGHQGNNSVWRFTRPSVTGWNDGPANMTNGGTLNGWTTQANFSGDATELLTTPENVLFHNQYMSVAPLGINPNEFIVTQDIGPASVIKMTVPSTTGNTTPLFEAVRTGQGNTDSSACWEVFGLWTQNQFPPRNFVITKSTQAGAAVNINNPQTGTPSNWGTYATANKVCFSADGINWGELYQWNNVSIDRAFPCGNHVVLPRVGAVNREVISVPIPPMIVGRPLVVSPAVVNFADGDMLQADPPGGAGTFTDVTATYQNAGFVAGRDVIPRVPCFSKVYRVTARGDSEYLGSRFIVASGSVLGHASNPYTIKVKAWFRHLPVAVPFVNNSTAPFNTVRPPLDLAFTFGNGSAGFITGVANMDGNDWVPVTFEFRSDGWTTKTGRLRLGFQIQNGFPNKKKADFLVAIESVTCATPPASGTIAELPVTCPPLASGTTPSSTINDTLETVGFNPTATWTVAVALQNLNDGPDVYDIATRPNNGTRRLFTLKNAPGTGADRYISARFDFPNDQIVFTNGTDTFNLGCAANHDFNWARNTQCGIVISRNDTSGAMVFAAFMGGTKVATGSATWAQTIRPTNVSHANTVDGPTEPHAVHRVWMNEDAALDQTAAAALLTSGTFLANPSSSRASFSTIIFDD